MTKISHIMNIVPFLPITRVHLANFWRCNMFKDTFRDIKWICFTFYKDIFPKIWCMAKEGPKKQSYFENCAGMSHFAQFRGFIWPFFVNITCSRTLFRGFLGLLFHFWRDINIQDHCSARSGQKITKLSVFCPRSGFFAKYGLKMEPLGLQSQVKHFFTQNSKPNWSKAITSV